MSKRAFFVTVGALVAIFPFLGLPRDWDVWILPALGGLIVLSEAYLYLLEYWRRTWSEWLEERKVSSQTSLLDQEGVSGQSGSEVEHDEEAN